MANLTTLLGLLGAQNAGQTVDTVGLPQDEINVLGGGLVSPQTARTNQTTSMMPEAPRDLSPMPRVSASEQELAGTQNYDNLPQHKGLFGLKGTLRDVLGLVGDTLSGSNIYGDKRQQERESDATVGFTSANPQTRLAAINRLAQVNPARAQQLYQQFQAQQHQADQIEAQRAQYAAQGARQDSRNQLQKIKIAQTWAANTQDPTVLASIKEWIQDPSATLDDIPESVLAASAINPYQRAQLGQGQARIDETGRHNKVSEGIAQKNASRPRSAPQARAQTSLEYVKELMGKKNRTADEQAYLDNELGRNKGKESSVLDRLRTPAVSGVNVGQVVTQNNKRYQKQSDGSFKPL